MINFVKRHSISVRPYVPLTSPAVMNKYFAITLYAPLKCLQPLFFIANIDSTSSE